MEMFCSPWLFSLFGMMVPLENMVESAFLMLGAADSQYHEGWMGVHLPVHNCFFGVQPRASAVGRYERHSEHPVGVEL
jgi:hypothetical protein